MKWFRSFTVAIAVNGSAILVGVALLGVLGIRINTTPSIPKGIYLIADAPIERGRYVIFCPPNAPLFDEARKRGYIGAGFCAGGTGQMMKKILAAKGDEVIVSDAGVSVNGVLLPLSAPLAVDGSGRSLPRFRPDAKPIASRKYLLMSDVTDKSFDSRYFGLIDETQIRGVVRPLFIW